MEKEKNTIPLYTELCEARTQTFCTEIDNRVIYISVTVQDMPSNIAYVKNNHNSLGDFMQGIGSFIDELAICHPSHKKSGLFSRILGL